MGKGSQPATQETKQTTEPWDQQKPYLEDVFKQAKNLYNTGGPQAYPGSTVVPMNDTEQYALNYLKGTAMSGMQGNIGKMQQATDFGLGGVLDPSSNVALQAHAQGAIQPIFRDLTESALPQVRNDALAAGQFGGSRQGIAEGQAIGRAMDTAGNVTSGIYSDAYNRGLSTFSDTLRNMPSLMEAQVLPAQLLSSAGSQQRSFEQALLDEQIARYNYNQSLPFTNLAQYQNFVQGNYGGTSTSTALQNVGGNNGAQTAMGLGSMALMAMLAFSDRRCKTDVKKIGMHKKGFPIYSFKYTGGNGLYSGPMAQEVEAAMPDAVVTIGGLKYIKLNKLN